MYMTPLDVIYTLRYVVLALGDRALMDTTVCVSRRSWASVRKMLDAMRFCQVASQYCNESCKLGDRLTLACRRKLSSVYFMKACAECQVELERDQPATLADTVKSA